MKWIHLAIPLLFPLAASGQDAYHDNLQQELQSSYGLPTGAWVLPNTETGLLAADISYGNVATIDQNTAGQDFSKNVQVTATQVPGPQYNSGYVVKTVSPVNEGDVLLLVVWMRAVGSEGKVTLVMENATTYANEFSLDYPLGTGWQQYMIPFQASASYAAGNFQASFHLNWKSQVVQIGGLAMLNYGNSAGLDELPDKINNEFYGGWEANAPWRAEANDRIEQIRKADLDILVVNEFGEPIEGAEVEVKMLQHEYAFGSAIVAAKIAENSNYDAFYENKLLDLDGQGHGFNWVVFENDFKWNAWEDNWFSTTPQDKAEAVQWLMNHDIKLRGHTLLWPSWGNLPADLQANQNNPNYLLNRIENHIEEIVTYPGIAGKVAEWDVLNEISILHDLEDALEGSPSYPTGREVYADVFNKLLQVDPEAVTYINDYTTFGQGNVLGLSEVLKQYIQEIADEGLPVDGIGFQAHIAAFPTSIPEVYDILEDFYNTFGARSKITEFDMHQLIDEDLAATYLSDFFRIVFSHESSDGILMWGFWDGAHWHGNAPLFRQDWSLKPAGQAFFDLVFGEWWTEETGLTNADGVYSFRGFKGTYEIKATCNDFTVVENFQLSEDQETTLLCGITGITEGETSPLASVFPNPAQGMLHLGWNLPEEGEVWVTDLLGRQKLTRKLSAGENILPLALPPGVYQIIATTKQGRRYAQKLIVGQ